jgi:hypothetical protein
MRNKSNIDLKTGHLPLFALAWQSWKLLDTTATIVFKGAVVAGAFFFFVLAVSQGPLVNKEAQIRMDAEKDCVAQGLQDLRNNRYDVYRICHAYAVQYARQQHSRRETNRIY